MLHHIPDPHIYLKPSNKPYQSLPNRLDHVRQAAGWNEWNFSISFQYRAPRDYRDRDLRSPQNQFALILWIPQAPLPHNSHERLSNLFLMLIDCEITNFQIFSVLRIRKTIAKISVGTRI